MHTSHENYFSISHHISKIHGLAMSTNILFFMTNTNEQTLTFDGEMFSIGLFVGPSNSCFIQFLVVNNLYIAALKVKT